MNLDSDFSIQYTAEAEELNFLWSGIYRFNETVGPMLKYPPYEPYRIVVRNADREIVAGILSKVYLKCLFIELFWIDERYRRQRIGSELLRSAEEHARSLGCTFAHLDTFSFQAIDFYSKQGYEIFAVLEDYPDENIKRYFLKKYLG